MNMMKWKIGVILVFILATLNTATAVQIEEVGRYTDEGMNKNQAERGGLKDILICHKGH
ncbi:MAG: hypothetical protein KAV25_04855 [Methanophagales archaeon]|nr:hypothetical protein [Methanophagales archaeon]